MIRSKYTFTIICIMLLGLTAAIMLQKTRAATGQQLVFTAYVDDNALMEDGSLSNVWSIPGTFRT